MKNLLIVVLTLSLMGCTSLRPVELPAKELQEKIANEYLLKAGDRVKLVLDSGEHKEFKIKQTTPTHVEGDQESIPIDSIVALESRQFSGGKTALLAGGGYVLYALLAAIGASIMVGF